jgi:hypothetical protein
MKNQLLFILVIHLVFLASCKDKIQERTVTCIQSGDYDYLDQYSAGSLCTSDICTQYQAIWKELFMAKNSLSESYFQDHILISNTAVNSWNDGISFSICYKVKIGWAIAWECDQFIIKINKDKYYYPTLNLPRDQYLSKDEIQIAVDGKAFSSHIIKLSNAENLKFNSMNKALDELIRAANINTLCSGMIFIDESTGNLTLEAGAQYENEQNSCIQGRIDLINGSTSVTDTPCAIF